MGRYVPPKRPYQCEPKRYYNTEDCILNLSGLINTGMNKKKRRNESRKQTHCNSLCPVFIQCCQEEHCSAL